jgi:hypothetical protein
MIQRMRVVRLVCDNEHGAGDEIFPGKDRDAMYYTVAELRKAAKDAGWTRKSGNDYCDYCSERERESE